MINTWCASPRSHEMVSATQMDVDLKQQLIYMQMSLKEIGAAFNGLERKIDATGHSISSLEQQLLQMKNLQLQAQIHGKMERGPTLVEFDNLMKKNMQENLALQDGQGGPHSQGGQDPHQLADIGLTQTESLRRLEQGVSDLLVRSMSAGQENKFMSQGTGAGFMLGMGSSPGPQQPTEGKAGASDYNGCNVRSQVREELDIFHATLMKDFTQVQDRLMQEFQQYSKTTGLSDLSYHLPSKGDGLKDLRDLSMTAMMANPIPVMSDVVMPSADSDFAQPCLLSSSAPVNKQEPIKAIPEEVVEVVEEAAEVEEDDEGHDHVIELKESDGMGSVFMCDDDMDKPCYSVESFYWKHGHIQSIARSNNFANFTVFVVVLNAIYIGFDSDWNTADNIYAAHWAFQACSQFFCVYFTWELVIRFLAFEKKHDCLIDGWFKFDAFLVSTMILDTWILMPTLFIVGGNIKVPTQPLRMLRLFKLTRMARLMKAFPELVTMIKGLVRSLRAISSSMILIGLMVYVWAIMMHMLMKDEDEFNDTLWKENLLGFDTITRCIWTLLMDGTLMLDNAAPLMTSLLFSHELNYILAGIFFMLYALLSAMLILQMLIGVLCDVVSRVGSEQRDATAIGLVKQELRQELMEADGGDGKISQEELLKIMKNPHSKALMRKLNINAAFLAELQKMMFTKPGQQVSIKQVLNLMIMCRGDNATTVESMSGAILSIITEIVEVRKILERDMGVMRQNLEDSISHIPGVRARKEDQFYNCPREVTV